MVRKIGILAVCLMVLAASGTLEARGDDITPQESELACITMNTERLPLDGRRSPLDSVTFVLQTSPVKVCYGRPSARGRAIFGGLLPYDQLWRTGANEPTMIHTPIGLSIAGIAVGPGSYSIYSVPGESEWEIIVNRSTSQWGHESSYESVRSQEVGRAKLKSEATDDHVEVFTIRATPNSDRDATLLLEWERTRVAIPITVGGA
ncbi:MAG: DUF2911 domain-containing protein [Gemmatimonadales bacterium]|jgi:hypothetical protein